MFWTGYVVSENGGYVVNLFKVWKCVSTYAAGGLQGVCSRKMETLEKVNVVAV